MPVTSFFHTQPRFPQMFNKPSQCPSGRFGPRPPASATHGADLDLGLPETPRAQGSRPGWGAAWHWLPQPRLFVYISNSIFKSRPAASSPLPPFFVSTPSRLPCAPSATLGDPDGKFISGPVPLPSLPRLPKQLSASASPSPLSRDANFKETS